jgi:NhaP-type Na+/H+ or K+/H+ antiporter
MSADLWYILVGALLVAMALADSKLRRLPLTTAMLYLAAGVVLGPVVLARLVVDPVENAALIERVAEIVVIVALFAAGLKLRAPLSERRWRVPIALAFASMAITVGLIALVGWALMGLSIGASVLLGAVLAPTDPVLASDVQVDHPTDRDRLRFSLTAEAGLNDGTAFPFVMLGLGLLGLRELGDSAWRWLAVDVLWAIGAGIVVGALLGTLIGRLVLYLRREHREALGLDDFLALGLIALAYGSALAIHAYGFLAVFAAGLALRRIERQETGAGAPPPEVAAASASEEATEAATGSETAHAYMAQAVLGFTEQLERIGTVAVVLLVGTMLVPSAQALPVIWFAPLLLLVIRPLAVAPVLLFARLSGTQRGLIAWFGIRGIGSIYYLAFAVARGVPEAEARVLMAVTLWVVAVSIVVHGLSVKPLMRLHEERRREVAARPASS